MSATTAEEFLQKCREGNPRDTRIHLSSLRAFAEYMYKPQYKSPEITCHCEDWPQLFDWVQVNLNTPFPVGYRRKSLVIFGDTRIGRTLWARSLGKHAYFPARFMLEDFNPDEVDYAVFDDFINGFGSLPNFKGWFGSQSEPVINAKYQIKKRITWGKPPIYIGNTDPREWMSAVQMAWLEISCLFVHVTSQLCKPYAP